MKSEANSPSCQFGPGLCFYPEIGVPVRSWKKGPGRTLVRSSGSEKGSGLTLVPQVRSLEKEPFFCFVPFFLLLFFSIFSFFFYFFSILFSFFLFFSFFYFFFIFFPFFFLGVWRKERLFLRTPNLLNQGMARSFLRTPNLPGFGERNWPFSELRTCRTRVGPGSFSKLRTCQSSEFGERNGPFSELRTCRTRVIPGPFSEL